MESRFSEKQIQELLKIKEKVLCKKCNQSGYLETRELCDCMKKFVFIKELFYSGIHSEFWKYNFENLEIAVPKIVEKYVENLDIAISKGLGIIFTSEARGTGKTTLMSMIGKEAVIKQKKVFYCFLQNIMDDKFTETKEFEKRIRQSDLVLIDEIDKTTFKKDSVIKSHFEILLRTLLSNGKSVLMSTNGTREEIDETFGMNSYFYGYLKTIEVSGENIRSKRGDKWDDLIVERKKYQEIVDIKDAERFIQEREKNEPTNRDY